LIKRTISLISFSLLFSGSALARNCTEASFYALDGALTSNGEVFNSYSHTAAHPYYRFGTKLRVTNQRNGKSVIVRITDRGPFVAGRSLDMSLGAFSRIENTNRGIAQVCYTRL
jgi:rare lipoprotein A